jgi:starch synthase
LKILHISAECAPFAKTGGLGDVLGALPKAQRAQGHDVRVALPLYRRVRDGRHAIEPLLPAMEIELGAKRHAFAARLAKLPESDVPVWLVDCPTLYDRPQIYTMDGDEHTRFAMLGWAALRIAQQLRFDPDIVHVHDWQAGLVPLTLKTLLAWDRLFERTRTVLTIHNIGYQGTFGANVLADTGLERARDQFHQDELNAGRLSYLLTGILYANAITTVSPTYAEEIMTPEHGVGLDPYLRARRDVVFGILNGIDERVWSPSSDGHLSYRYGVDDLELKERNKEELVTSLGLVYRPGVPLVGIVSRLAWQKGFDLCMEVLPPLFGQREMQLVVLGSGERRYEEFFARLANAAPRKVSFVNAFSEALAHKIEAGSDLFLMPSRYEPCGLNQMYSLAYGTPPIVHRTGGLADTVRHWNPRTGEGNGFVFEHFDARGLMWAMRYALDCFDDRRSWRRLQENGMRERHSWERRVREYDALYRKLVP